MVCLQQLRLVATGFAPLAVCKRRSLSRKHSIAEVPTFRNQWRVAKHDCRHSQHGDGRTLCGAGEDRQCLAFAVLHNRLNPVDLMQLL